MANITKEQRAERELAAKYDAGEIIENNRVTVSNTAAHAPKQVTPAAAALPMGTPGTVDLDNAQEAVRAAVAVTHNRQPMTKIRWKRGYFKVSGGAKSVVGDEEVLPQVDARYLIESGIAEYVDHFISEK